MPKFRWRPTDGSASHRYERRSPATARRLEFCVLRMCTAGGSGSTQMRRATPVPMGLVLPPTSTGTAWTLRSASVTVRAPVTKP